MGSSEFQDSRFKAGSGFKLETENFELCRGSTESRPTLRRIRPGTCIGAGCGQRCQDVTKPLAIVFYEKLLPGSRVGHKLADLGWRVSEVKLATDLVRQVREEKPVLLVVELGLRSGDLCPVIAELSRSPETSHVPVLGFGDPKNQKLVDAAVKAGARLVAAEAGILDQLPHLLEHVLAVD